MVDLREEKGIAAAALGFSKRGTGEERAWSQERCERCHVGF